MEKSPGPDRKKIQLGRRGEELAAAFLEQQGIDIIARNVRTPYGELDLVGRSSLEEIIFFEVKTRTGAGFGYPEEAVHRKKRIHLYQSALFYINEMTETGLDWRIDVIAVYQNPEMNKPDFHWIENAVTEPE